MRPDQSSDSAEAPAEQRVSCLCLLTLKTKLLSHFANFSGRKGLHGRDPSPRAPSEVALWLKLRSLKQESERPVWRFRLTVVKKNGSSLGLPTDSIYPS